MVMFNKAKKNFIDDQARKCLKFHKITFNRIL